MPYSSSTAPHDLVHSKTARRSNVIAMPERGNFTSVIEASGMAGVSMRVFLAAVYAGDIPLSLYKIGKRRFVRSHDLKRWLEAASPVAPPGRSAAPNPDLF